MGQVMPLPKRKKEKQTDNRMWVLAIAHADGLNLYTSRKRQGVWRIVVAWCEEHWRRVAPKKEPIPTTWDEEVVDRYFDMAAKLCDREAYFLQEVEIADERNLI